MFAERYHHLLEIAKEFYFREYTCIVFKKDYVQEGLYRRWRHDPLLGIACKGFVCTSRTRMCTESSTRRCTCGVRSITILLEIARKMEQRKNDGCHVNEQLLLLQSFAACPCCSSHKDGSHVRKYTLMLARFESGKHLLTLLRMTLMIQDLFAWGGWYLYTQAKRESLSMMSSKKKKRSSQTVRRRVWRRRRRR